MELARLANPLSILPMEIVASMENSGMDLPVPIFLPPPIVYR